MTEQIEQPAWIESNWPTPANIHAGTSTRLYGDSEASFASLNLATHVGDDQTHVSANRRKLSSMHQLPAEPIWLEQVHGNHIINLDQSDPHDNTADGIFTRQPGRVCSILTADCLPLLICDDSGSEIAALHAGWRGLASGIIEKALPMFSCPNPALSVWMGPAISARNYEVDDEVKSQFDHLKTLLQDDTFIPCRPGHWLVSLYRITMLILKDLGVQHIHGGQYCTFRDADLFYSHRRDEGTTGRMASLIWMDPQ